jgi:carbonic anhydrase
MSTSKQFATLFALVSGLVATTGSPSGSALGNEPEHSPAAAHASNSHDSTTAMPSAAAEPKSDAHDQPKAAMAPAPRAKAKPANASGKKKPASEPDAAGVSAADALKLIQEGNERWASGKPTDPSTDASRRTQQAEGQTPFVSVLTCADSRIPLERVFDRGVGEIFGVRVAGNIAGDSEIGTLEYGIGHLKTKLLVVMGHTKCGAVAAAASGAKLHGKVAELVANIQPAVERAKRANPSADDKELASLAIKENVWQTVYALLQNSADLRDAVDSGQVQVVGALYDIASGKVEFLGEHPWQRELLAAAKAKAPATATAEEK